MGFDPLFKYSRNKESIIEDLFHKQENQGSPFKVGDIAIGFMQLGWHKWLLFYVGEITKYSGNSGLVYEGEPIEEYKKYFGRLIVEYHNKTQQLVRKANGLIQELKVHKIIDDIFENRFPGYENVCINWNELDAIKNNDSWRTALQNQKGIYLITDCSNGKMYVGSATGREMILGRWTAYIGNGHGGNKDLEKVVNEKGFDYIKQNFQYSILEIFQSKVPEEVIIQREFWWKEVLQSRKFGYNN